jgi:hypothetical protein
MSGAKSVQGSQLRDDGGLVVGGRAREHPVFAVDPAERRSERGGALPFGRSDGLAVVVGVKNDGVLRLGRSDLSENDGIYAWHGKQACLDAALLQHNDEGVGVALDVSGIAGNVGDREQLGEFLQDLGAVGLLPIVRCRLHGVVLGVRDAHEYQSQEDVRAKFHGDIA